MNGQVPEKVTGSVASRDYGGESPSLASIQQRVRALNAKGWSLYFRVDWSGDWTVSGDAGDCNCPHIKDYDPRDGHGFSSFDCDDNVWCNRETGKIERNGKADSFRTFEEALAYAESEVDAIVPGSGKPPVVRAPAPAPKIEVPRRSIFKKLFGFWGR